MEKPQNIDGVLYIKGPDGNLYRYADVLEANNPGIAFDLATGEPLYTIPPKAGMDGEPRKHEYHFGDVGSQAGNEDLAAAGDIWANAGDVTRNMLPEGLQPYVGRSASYLPDMALGGLVGGWGAAQKGIGYGAEVADAGARGLAGLLGIDWPYAPGTSARKLTNDILGGIEVAGVGPEARMLGMASEAAKPAIRSAAQARTAGIFDLLQQGRR